MNQNNQQDFFLKNKDIITISPAKTVNAATKTRFIIFELTSSKNINDAVNPTIPIAWIMVTKRK